MKKIYPNRTRIILYLAIVAFIIAGLFFWIFKDFFLSEWNVWHILIVSGFVICITVLSILTLKSTYYVIESNHLSFFRLGKELRYSYKDIIYIDESKGEKTKTLGFFTKHKKVIYLTLDSDGIIYRELLKRCTNLITTEEFIRKYPNVDI